MRTSRQSRLVRALSSVFRSSRNALMRKNPPKDPPEKEGGALTGPVILHATTVAHHGRALVILGASGAGKSSLALQLIALG